MSYDIVIRPEAEADITDAYRWYEERDKGLGIEFLRCLEASLNSIKRNPEMYQRIHKNIHRTLIRKFPYGMFYIIDQNKIAVLAVFHTHRDPKEWQNRL